MHDQAAGNPQADPATDPEAALREALEERARLWHDAQRAHALEHDLDQMRRVLEDMQGSVSWRVTAPLRRLKTGIQPRVRTAAVLARKARAQLRG